MTEPYSLAVEPWLPVATKDGRRTFIPISDIGRPDLLRVDTGRPDCDISLTEFLIGLVAISMGPSGGREWKQQYETPPSPKEIEDAIMPFAHALVLDGEGSRFFQDFEAINGDAVPVSSLLMDMPGAQTLKDNADHFVKRGGVAALSRKGAAIALLTLQTSAPSGGAGHRTSLRGGGPATTLVIPRCGDKPPTLWQLLLANVPEGFRIDPSEAEKVMPWLTPTRTSEKGLETTPEDTHKAQAFFGMPRRVRLIFEPANGEPCALTGENDTFVVKSYVTKPWGLNYPTTTWKHPLSPYYRSINEKSNEWLPLHFKSSAIGYRQWVGLTLKAKTNETALPADIISLFRKDRAKRIGIDTISNHRVGILAAGYAMDNMKPLDFAEAMLPLISTGDEDRDADLTGCAAAMVGGAEAAQSMLLSALKVALWSASKQGQPDNGKALLAAARARFWADTEQAFYGALRGLAARADDQGGRIYSDAREAWQKTIREAALAIFDDLAPIDAPDSPDIKNIVNARKHLFYGLQGPAVFKALGLETPEKQKRKGKANGKGRQAA